MTIKGKDAKVEVESGDGDWSELGKVDPDETSVTELMYREFERTDLPCEADTCFDPEKIDWEAVDHRIDVSVDGEIRQYRIVNIYPWPLAVVGVYEFDEGADAVAEINGRTVALAEVGDDE